LFAAKFSLNFFFWQFEINKKSKNIRYLKGSDLQEETKPYKKYVFVKKLSDWFDEEYFETKKVVQLPV
jgi:16S rRNA (guanine527-N7)-methyltransferase